jgi:hypothetical protein
VNEKRHPRWMFHFIEAKKQCRLLPVPHTVAELLVIVVQVAVDVNLYKLTTSWKAARDYLPTYLLVVCMLPELIEKI